MLSASAYKVIIDACITEDGMINSDYLDISSATALNLLRYAIIYDDIEAIEALVKSKIDINYRDDEKALTPLVMSIEQKCNDITKYLIKEGADVNATMEKNWTALIFAIHANNNIIVSELIDNNIDVNKETDSKETALMWAVVHNNSQIVDLLIKAGANVNVQNIHGYTALMFASQRDNKIIAKQLIDAEADVTLTNDKKENALIITITHGSMCTMNFLKQFYPPGGYLPNELTANE